MTERKMTNSKPLGSHPGDPLSTSRDEGYKRGEQVSDAQIGATAVTTVPTVAVEDVTPRELAARLRDLHCPDEDFADDLEAVQAAMR